MRSIMAGGLIVVVLMAGCGSADSGGRGDAPAGTRIADRVGTAVHLLADVNQASPDAAAIGPISRSEQDFAVALLQKLSWTDQNVTVSPSSLAIALTMLEDGAGATTRQQIAAALQAGSLPVAAQNEGWRALAAQWSTAARTDDFQLHSANAVWAQQRLPVRTSYLDALARYYGTGVWRVDFRRGADALNAVNDWTKQQTNGKITKLFDALDPQTELVLANALYFKAQWATKFMRALTTKGSFTTASGARVTVPLMHSEQLTAPAARTPGYEAVQLPYRGGRFAALAVMPTSGTLGSLTASLTSDRLAQIVSSLRSQPVDVVLPRFTTGSTLDLPQTLQSLGMVDAFGPSADFSALSPAARRLGLYVDQVIQRTYLSVTEYGTEAAAATGTSVIASAAVRSMPIHFVHPFLFVIRDVKTGVVLFASQINDPSAG